MILHLLRMRRNVSRNVFNDRKNVSATPSQNRKCSSSTRSLSYRRALLFDLVGVVLPVGQRRVAGGAAVATSRPPHVLAAQRRLVLALELRREASATDDPPRRHGDDTLPTVARLRVGAVPGRRLAVAVRPGLYQRRRRRVTPSVRR